MQSSNQAINLDLNADNITQNVIALNSQSPNERLSFILERLVLHLHDLARETRLTTKEWMEGLMFLTQTGQTCTSLRQVRNVKTDSVCSLLSRRVLMLILEASSSFYSLISLACRYSLIQSTTPSLTTRLRGVYLARFTLTMRKPLRSAKICHLIQKANLVS